MPCICLAYAMHMPGICLAHADYMSAVGVGVGVGVVVKLIISSATRCHANFHPPSHNISNIHDRESRVNRKATTMCINNLLAG